MHPKRFPFFADLANRAHSLPELAASLPVAALWMANVKTTLRAPDFVLRANKMSQ
jgi:hypothetical protein